MFLASNSKMDWRISTLLSGEHLEWKLCLMDVVNFPTCMQPWLETLSANSNLCFSFQLPLHLSTSWLACLMAPLLSVIEFAPLFVSLQTSWVTGRLIYCMLAVGTTTCEQKGKKCTHSWDCDQILSHPVSKKGHEETCGMYDMTIKGLLAFFPFNCLPESFSHPFFLAKLPWGTFVMAPWGPKASHLQTRAEHARPVSRF